MRRIAVSFYQTVVAILFTVQMSESIFCDLYLSLLCQKLLYVFAVLKKVWQLYRIQMLQNSRSAAQFGGKEGSDLKVGQHFDYF